MKDYSCGVDDEAHHECPCEFLAGQLTHGLGVGLVGHEEVGEQAVVGHEGIGSYGCRVAVSQKQKQVEL